MIPDSVKHPAKMSWNLLERIFKHLESLDMLTHESIVIDFMAGTGKTGTMAALRRYRTISVELEPHFIEMIAGYDCDGKSISDFKIEPCVCKSDTLREPPSDKSDGFSRPPEGLVSQHIPEQERMDIVGSALCEPSFRGQPVNSKYVSQVYISNPHNNNEMEKGGTIHPPDKFLRSSASTLHKPHKIKTGLFEVECSGNPRIVPVCRCGGKHLHKKHHVIGNKELLEQVTGRKVRWDVIQGDARELTKLLHESDFVGVVSPPYFSQVAYQDKEFIKSIAEDKSQRYRDGRLKGHFATPEAIRRYAEKIMETYSLDPRNIGNLPDKPLVAIVSPPYAEAQQGGGIAIEGYNGPHIHEMGKNQPGKVGRACGYMKEFHGSDYAQIGNMKDIPLVAVVSPPYQDTAMSMGCPSHIRKLAREGDWDKAIELERKSEAEQAKKGNKYAVSTDETIRKKIEMALERERGNYSENPDNIGNLPDNKGNQPGESYLSAMFKVYQQAFLCGISPLVVVTKNPTRNGALRRLDLDTISLLQASGYEIFDYHRAILFETHTQNTLDGESRDVHKGRISFFKRLSLEKGTAVAQWEDIIFARIPIKCARSISELRAPDSGREFVTCPR